MFYGKGGAVWLEAEGRYDGFSERASDWGWVVGGGVEHLVRANVSLGIEGLFHRWRDFEDSGIDFDATTVQARISYRF